MRAVRERWVRFWFKPVDPLNLGLCRVFFFGVFFLFYFGQSARDFSGVSADFWRPIWLFETFNLPVFSVGVLAVFVVVWKVSMALSCLGLFTRVSTVLALVFGTYLLALPQNFGKTGHAHTIVVVVMGIMALSRCGDGFSVDRLIRKARQRNNAEVQRPLMSGEYTWPVRAAWLALAFIYFAAGVSKLRHSGLDWIFSDNMATLLISRNYLMNHQGDIADWGFYIAQYTWLPVLMAATTVVFEIGYPVALFSARSRFVIIPTILLFHIGNGLLVGPKFYQYMICNVIFWIPWDRVSRGFVSGLRKLSPLRKHSLPYGKDLSGQNSLQR